jgi:hypothetical protein
MTKENPNNNCNRYRINVDTEDLINIYTKKWVLRWCKENHPEAFEDGKRFVEGLIKEEKGIALDKKL